MSFQKGAGFLQWQASGAMPRQAEGPTDTYTTKNIGQKLEPVPRQTIARSVAQPRGSPWEPRPCRAAR